MTAPLVVDAEEFVPGRMPQQLLNYWVHGKGALKIRWGTPGDFNRCRRNLAKYFPRNPEGLCNRLHTRALGKPPGQGHAAEGEEFLLEIEDDTIYEDELALFPVKKMWRGTLAPVNKPTGDRRRFAIGSIGHRDLPLALLWQKETGEGHKQSVIVGRILSIEVDDERVFGLGDWLDTDEAREAQELMKAGILHPSVDLDNVEFELRLTGTDETFSPETHCDGDACAKHEAVVTSGRVSAATLVAIPAFAEAKLELFDGVDEEAVIAAFDAMPVEAEAEESCGCGMTASAMMQFAQATTPVYGFGTPPPEEHRPPRAWFAQPDIGPDPGWYYTREGRVFGRIGGEGVCHLGIPDCKTIPHSQTGYAFFHQSWTYTAEGERLKVGKLIYGGKHPSLQAGLRGAWKHYDDTTRAFAIGRVYEDEHGPVFAGALLPDVDPTMLAHALASPLSGDWRDIGGSLEMIAALAVNVPGFPVVARTDENQRMTALVASAGLPAELVEEGPPVVPELEEVQPLISEIVAAEFAAAREREAELAEWAAITEDERAAQVDDLARAFD